MHTLSKLNTGLPYYINHAIIAVVIGFIFGNFFVGAAFYVGRELRDWEKLGYFDHPGFWWPIVTCVSLESIKCLLK
jgi:hypothetical protein